MSPKARSALLIVALATTLGAVYWASRLDGAEETVEVFADSRPRPAASETAASRGSGELDLERLRRGPSLEPNVDPFALRNFRPAPPAVKRPIALPASEVAAPPPPPQAPPLPFMYMGKLAEGDSTTVFLSMGDRNLIVRPGDVIDNNYRVEEVTDAAVVLTYLPLTVQQSLPIGVKQ